MIWFYMILSHIIVSYMSVLGQQIKWDNDDNWNVLYLASQIFINTLAKKKYTEVHFGK